MPWGDVGKVRLRPVVVDFFFSAHASQRLDASAAVEDMPMLTQVSDQQEDSQVTEVGDDDEADSQARLSSAIVSTNAAGVVIAFDSNRSPEDGGGSGREVLERAPSRTNGVPDDTPDCPSPI